MQAAMQSRITKGVESLGTTESTIETTKNYNPSSPLGRRSQTQLGQRSLAGHFAKHTNIVYTVHV
jgi:hypothetical protein